MFSKEELKRYNRHIILDEVGIGGQEKLKSSKVLIIGAGGLGCPIIQYLAAVGVGTIGIIDNDKVDESNLQRQILYTLEDVGKWKAEVAFEKVKKANPYVDVRVFKEKLTKENALNIISNFDIIVDGSDNFPTRYLANDASVILKKPLVFGSIFKFEGQVTVFNYKDGPTYRCLFPEPPSEGDVPNCSHIGVIGVLPGIIGTMQAIEVIKIITGIGQVLKGRLFVIDLLSFQSQTYKFSKNPSNQNIDSLLDSYEDFCNSRNLGGTMVEEIDVYDLEELLNGDEDIQLIDVRTREESEICSLGGINIPLNELTTSLEKIDKDRFTVIYCHHGQRSKEAAEFLKSTNEFRRLKVLKGGIHEWALYINEEMGTY